MEEIDCEISPDGGNFKIGDCEINVSSKSLQKGKKVKLKLIFPSCCDGYLPASATLVCDPPVSRFRKHVHVKIPVWYSPLKSSEEIDVPIYTKQDGKWKELDTAALIDEKFVEIQIKELDNVTVFLPKKILPEVQLHAKSYLFLNRDTSLKIAFATDDKVVESALISEMKKSQHELLRDKPNNLPACFGDEMEYYFSHTDKKKNSENSRLGQVVVDENLLEYPIKEIGTHDLKANPFETSTFAIRHYRTEQEERQMVDEDTYIVEIQDNFGCTPQSLINVEGKFTCDNFISNATNVHIDQRTVIDESGEAEEIKGRDVKKTQPALQVVTTGSHKDRAARKRGNLPGVLSKINFAGDVRVGNFVTQADNVVIDQRKTRKQKSTSQPEQKFVNAVSPEEEETVSVQVDGGSDVDHDTKETERSMDRTFESPQGRQESNEANQSQPASCSNSTELEHTKP